MFYWFWRILALLALVPLVELALLLEVGRLIGTWRTVAIVIVTAIIGSYLTSREGTRVLGRIKEQLTHGTVPSDALFDAALIGGAGLLLLTPGLLTDVMGFLCLIPATRTVIQRWIARRAESFIMDRY